MKKYTDFYKGKLYTIKDKETEGFEDTIHHIEIYEGKDKKAAFCVCGNFNIGIAIHNELENILKKAEGWKSWNVGDRVKYTYEEFGGSGSYDGTITEKFEDHLIMECDFPDNDMHLWIDDITNSGSLKFERI